MTRDELKVRVNNRVMSHLLHGAMIPGVEDAIIDIIAPELEKARKWDRVEGALKELKKGVDCVSDALTEKEPL